MKKQQDNILTADNKNSNVIEVATPPLSLENWLKQYKPIRNENGQSESLPLACMFETFGPELARVKASPNNTIWTLVEGDTHNLIYPGHHHVNRIGYFICKVPWENPDLEVIYKTGRFLTIETTTASDVDDEDKWRLVVGAQCNRLLDLAETLEKSSKASDQQYAADLRSIIERVAEFEDLQTD